jgi:hypothetical protein
LRDASFDYSECVKFNIKHKKYPAPTAEELCKAIPQSHLIKQYADDGKLMIELFLYDDHNANYRQKSRWHTKLCEVYAEIALQIKEAGHEHEHN